MKPLLLAVLAAALSPLAAQVSIPRHEHATEREGIAIVTRDLRAIAQTIDQARRAEDVDASEHIDLESIARGLAQGVRAFLHPPLEKGEDVELVADRYLVAVGRTAQQKWIDRFLQSQASTADATVTIELHLFQAGATALEKAEIGDRPRSLSRKAGAELATALERDRLATGVKRRAMTFASYPMGRASLATLNQRSYVRDFEAVAAGGNVVVDPMVDMIQDGMTYTATAFHLEGGHIGLRGRVDFIDVLQPFPTKTVTLGPGAPVTIQVPARRQLQIPIDITVEDGGYAVLPGPVFEGRRLVAVLRAHSGN